MAQTVVAEQAQTVAALLPTLMRRLFAGKDDVAAQLPLAQLRVCSILTAGPRGMSALGRELGVSLSAMTQIADRLERARLVKRVPKGGDRRVRCLQLTDRGQKMMRLREQMRADRIQAVFEHLTPKARESVLRAMQMLLRASVTPRKSDGHADNCDSSLPTAKVRS